MPKRGAELKMNHENYEDPLPEEDAGEFVKAESEVIGTRKIIKARRRGNDGVAAGSAQPAQPAANPFKAFSFGAFGASQQQAKPQEPAKTAPLFGSILNQSSNANAENGAAKPAVIAENKFSNITAPAAAAAPTPAPVPAPAPAAAPATATANLVNFGVKNAASVGDSVSSSVPSESHAKREEVPSESSQPRQASGETQAGCRTYLKHLRKLNEDLLNWLSTNLKSNPFCILSPMFADYTRHLEEIERTYHNGPCAHHPNAEKTASSQPNAVKDDVKANASLGKPAEADPKTNVDSNASSGNVPKVSDLVALAQDIPDGPLLKGSESLASRGFQFSFKDTNSAATQKPTLSNEPAAEKSAAPAAGVKPSEPFRFGETSSIAAFSGSSPFVFGSNSTSTNFKFSFDASSSASASATTTTTSSTASSGATTTAPAFSTGSSLFSGVFNFKPQTATGTQPFPAFSFGATAPATSNGSTNDTKPKPAAATAGDGDGDQQQQEDGDEEYEPPKVERVEQREADATFSVRCKLLYRKLGGAAAASASNEAGILTKGVGTLSLKAVSGSAGDDATQAAGENAASKLQLIVRAETALATVLLNLLVAPSSLLRLSRNDTSKTVSFVTVPNPPFDSESSGKPMQLFIRVKTIEEVNELYEQLSRVVNA